MNKGINILTHVQQVPLLLILTSFLLCQTNLSHSLLITPPEPAWWHSNVVRDPAQRFSDYPLITSDSFRAASDFIFDETKIPLDTDLVKDGDIIYVTTPYLDFFFLYVHPHIHSHYILLSHFGDQSVPGPYLEHEYWKVLNDDTLAYWIGMNVDRPNHPKMIPIPIGLAPKNIVYKDFKAINEVIKQTPFEKKHLLYLNHYDGTNPTERAPIRTIFQGKDFCHIQMRKDFISYFKDIASSKFVISPPGSGHDCYKTWEALLVGTIPIVKRSPIIPIFKDLPVLIIDDWNEITESFLNEKYAEIASKSYRLEKLYFDYWLNIMLETKQRVKMSIKND